MPNEFSFDRQMMDFYCNRDKDVTEVETRTLAPDKQEKKPMTNSDCIRAMMDEELSDFLEAVTNACFERSNPRCPNCPMKWSAFCDIDGWLKQPAKEET